VPRPRSSRWKKKGSLVIVLVAKCRIFRVQEVSDAHIVHHSHSADNGIQGNRVVVGIHSVDLGEPFRVQKVEAPYSAVDRAMMEQEEYLTHGGLHICHDTANSVVAKAMPPVHHAIVHAVEIWVVVANVLVLLVAVLCQ
jgi:hypothetical protein